jgi:hypothetical protein
MRANSMRSTALRALILSLLLFANGPAAAHGDDGHSHGDEPAPALIASSPTMEAQSESFELVATLHPDELSVFVDRYASNEALLGAKLELDAGGRKYSAVFHADHGDYAFDDAALLELLSEAGEHPLVFSILSGAEADLLAGTLIVTADTHTHTALYLSWGGIALALVFVAAGIWVLRRRKQARNAI